MSLRFILEDPRRKTVAFTAFPSDAVVIINRMIEDGWCVKEILIVPPPEN